MSPADCRSHCEGDTTLKTRLKELFDPYIEIVLEAVLTNRFQSVEYTNSLKAQLKERFDICLEMSVDEILFTMRQGMPQLDASYETLITPLESVLKGPLGNLFDQYMS